MPGLSSHFSKRFAPWARRQRGRLIFYGGLVVVLTSGCTFVTHMPGRSYHGSPANTAPAGLEEALRRDVTVLAGDIGERSTSRPGALGKAEAYLSKRLGALGFTVAPHRYDADGISCANLEVVIPSSDGSPESVVVGAHYDSASGAPGADDNASGVAVVLALAERFRQRPPRHRALRFVLFTNEEPPHFWNPSMGSLVFAKEARAAGQAIVAMLSIESVGFYRQERGTQKYPAPMSLVYPSQGDFVGFVANTSSRGLLTKVIGEFRKQAELPSEGAALPGMIPGVGWSDHWSFWEAGYPAIMVTDTAPFRNPNYHTAGDRPETLDYARMAALTRGLDPVIERLRSER